MALFNNGTHVTYIKLNLCVSVALFVMHGRIFSADLKPNMACGILTPQRWSRVFPTDAFAFVAVTRSFSAITGTSK